MILKVNGVQKQSDGFADAAAEASHQLTVVRKCGQLSEIDMSFL